MVAPLAWTSGALAVMGGGLPLLSTVRPDLSSVALTSANTARFCFQKALGRTTSLKRADFMLGGYRARSNANTSSSTAFEPTVLTYDAVQGNCVDATFPVNTPGGLPIEYAQYTYGSVAAGAVQTSSGQANDADSTALGGSTSRSGTAGTTVAPNLAGVSVDPAHNVVQYVFDKSIGGVAVAPGSGFFIVDTGGDVCRQTTAAAIEFAGNVVTVTFPSSPTADCPAPFPTGPASVETAVKAGLDQLTVIDTTVGQFTEPNVDPQVAVVPGSSGTTARPDLVSASVSADGSTINFNFDQPIASAAAAKFEAVLSDDSAEAGSGAAVTNTSTTGTVTVAFIGGATFNEYDVKAVALTGAVTGTSSGLDDVDGSVPVGDNVGGFARGFTSGPDAIALTFDRATSVATVTFDQRVFANSSSLAPNPAGFVLLDAGGTPIRGGAGQTIDLVPASAGPMQVRVHFSASAFSTASGLEICGPPDDLATITPPAECRSATADSGSVWTSALGAAPEAPNVQQILSPFATSALLRGGGRVHTHWRRAQRVARDQLRAWLQRA